MFSSQANAVAILTVCIGACFLTLTSCFNSQIQHLGTGGEYFGLPPVCRFWAEVTLRCLACMGHWVLTCPVNIRCPRCTLLPSQSKWFSVICCSQGAWEGAVWAQKERTQTQDLSSQGKMITFVTCFFYCMLTTNNTTHLYHMIPMF